MVTGDGEIPPPVMIGINRVEPKRSMVEVPICGASDSLAAADDELPPVVD